MERTDSLQQALEQIKRDRQDLTRYKKIRDVVPIEQWIDNPYFVGSDGLMLYPFWKKHMIEIFKESREVKINEVVIQGSIGTGKSTFGLFVLIRRLYELSCYDNVKAMYRLMQSSIIGMIYFSLNKKQAEKSGFSQIRGLIDQIPYFRENFPRDTDIDSTIKLPQNIQVLYGSNNSHAIGLNIISSILDESNFHGQQDGQAITNEDYSKILDLYTSLMARSKSRFIVEGKNYSMNVLISSSTTEGSFTEQRITASFSDESIYVIDGKLWNVKPQGTYSEVMFYVFKGSGFVDPMIIKTTADLLLIEEGLEVENSDKLEVIKEGIAKMKLVNSSKILEVPIDFYNDFENDIIKALRDVGGESTTGNEKLFRDKPSYQQ